MSLMGYPLASSLQGLTPGQATFLEEALPRAEARRNGIDPDNPNKSGDGPHKPQSTSQVRESGGGRSKPRRRGNSELTQHVRNRRGY